MALRLRYLLFGVSTNITHRNKQAIQMFFFPQSFLEGVRYTSVSIKGQHCQSPARYRR